MAHFNIMLFFIQCGFVHSTDYHVIMRYSAVNSTEIVTAQIVCSKVCVTLWCLSVHLSHSPTAAACCGFASACRGQAISIDCYTLHLQQGRLPFNPYPQQHGSQQQMQAVSCLQSPRKLNTDLFCSASYLCCYLTQ